MEGGEGVGNEKATERYLIWLWTLSTYFPLFEIFKEVKFFPFIFLHVVVLFCPACSCPSNSLSDWWTLYKSGNERASEWVDACKWMLYLHILQNGLCMMLSRAFLHYLTDKKVCFRWRCFAVFEIVYCILVLVCLKIDSLCRAAFVDSLFCVMDWESVLDEGANWSINSFSPKVKWLYNINWWSQ